MGTEGVEPAVKEEARGTWWLDRMGQWLLPHMCTNLGGGESTPKGIQTLSGSCLGLIRSRGGGTTLWSRGEAAVPRGLRARAPGLTELAAGDPTPFLLAHFLWNGTDSRVSVSLLHAGSTQLGPFCGFTAGEGLCWRTNLL